MDGLVNDPIMVHKCPSWGHCLNAHLGVDREQGVEAVTMTFCSEGCYWR